MAFGYGVASGRRQRPAWRASVAGDTLARMAHSGDDIVERSGKVPNAARMMSAVATFGGRLVDLALPPQCLACHAPVVEMGSLCPSCWSCMKLIERPYCERLGIPFTYDLGPGALSAEAIAEPPPFDRCRAVAVYDDVARRLVHGLKYRDRLELARWMAGWMARAGGELIGAADVIVPVPLHHRRLWWRRYNQSALLVRELAAKAVKPCATDALVRIRATAQQVGLSADERDRNVRGAFRVTADGKRMIAGRRVLVVDDVYTTGATAKAATRALIRAGASAVDILVFARVVKGSI
jgi:ComF family protein